MNITACKDVLGGFCLFFYSLPQYHLCSCIVRMVRERIYYYDLFTNVIFKRKGHCKRPKLRQKKESLHPLIDFDTLVSSSRIVRAGCSGTDVG